MSILQKLVVTLLAMVTLSACESSGNEAPTEDGDVNPPAETTFLDDADFSLPLSTEYMSRQSLADVAAALDSGGLSALTYYQKTDYVYDSQGRLETIERVVYPESPSSATDPAGELVMESGFRFFTGGSGRRATVHTVEWGYSSGDAELISETWADYYGDIPGRPDRAYIRYEGFDIPETFPDEAYLTETDRHYFYNDKQFLERVTFEQTANISGDRSYEDRYTRDSMQRPQYLVSEAFNVQRTFHYSAAGVPTAIETETQGQLSSMQTFEFKKVDGEYLLLIAAEFMDTGEQLTRVSVFEGNGCSDTLLAELHLNAPDSFPCQNRQYWPE